MRDLYSCASLAQNSKSLFTRSGSPPNFPSLPPASSQLDAQINDREPFECPAGTRSDGFQDEQISHAQLSSMTQSILRVGGNSHKDIKSCQRDAKTIHPIP